MTTRSAAIYTLWVDVVIMLLLGFDVYLGMQKHGSA